MYRPAKSDNIFLKVGTPSVYPEWKDLIENGLDDVEEKPQST